MRGGRIKHPGGAGTICESKCVLGHRTRSWGANHLKSGAVKLCPVFYPAHLEMGPIRGTRDKWEKKGGLLRALRGKWFHVSR